MPEPFGYWLARVHKPYRTGMARKTIVRTITVSDISGTRNASLTRFSFNGRALEIDLTPGERATLRSLVISYGSYGRQVPAGTDRERRAYFAEVRRWGREHGWTVSGKGHVPKALLEAYSAAHR